MWIEAFCLTAVAFACLVPFVGKAFHIDDPPYLWVAEHIQSHPFDPYGFRLNWYLTELPVSVSFNNPPLACYYIALITWLFGWTEIVLHTSFLLPAGAAVLGSYALARQFCASPFYAGIAMVVTPAFLISSSTLMSDTIMLAFWTWAAVLWTKGVNRPTHWMLGLSSILIAAAALTKYSALILIPLLFLYASLRARRVGCWGFYLLIPLLLVAGFECLMRVRYGHGIITQASAYAASYRGHTGVSWFSKTLTGLVFTGGCLTSILACAPLFWPWRTCLRWAVCACLISATIFFCKVPGNFHLPSERSVRFWLAIECGVFAVGGMGLLALAVAEVRKRSDAVSLFLFAWVTATFVVAAYFNWTIAGRYILPMAPAAGILAARRLETMRTFGTTSAFSRMTLVACVAASAAIALSTTFSDFVLANSARSAAASIGRKFGKQPNQIWFQGHWGFHYYMQQSGFRAVDIERSIIQPRDILVVPRNNYDTFTPSANQFCHLERIELLQGRWLTTMCQALGTGFYSDESGPLPFAIARVPPEIYDVFQFQYRRPLRIKIDPEKAHYELALELESQNKVSEAIEEYSEALRLNSDYVEARNNLGLLLVSQGQSEEAIRQFSEAVRIKPSYVKAHFNLGLAMATRGQMEPAIAQFQMAIDLARASGQNQLADMIQKRIELLQGNRPNR